MERIDRFINELPCGEAKNLLLNLLLRVERLKESTVLSEDAMKDLLFLYEEIIGRSQNKGFFEREYETVHIVCGESSAGTLRVGLGHDHKVIGFPDFFAVGPIWKLDEEEGRQHRRNWLKAHLNMEIGDDYFEEEYEGRLLKACREIEAIAEDVPIVLWIAENPDEQIGIRYMMNLLKGKTNDLFILNTTTAYGELFDTNEVRHFCNHTAGADADSIQLIFEEKFTKPLSTKERQQFQCEWRTLSETTGVLRVWENEEIKVVEETYIDGLIVKCAEELHAEQVEKDFIKTGMLIARILGSMTSHVGDTFLEYRIRMLIIDGVFELRGIPKGIHHYEVKLK